MIIYDVQYILCNKFPTQFSVYLTSREDLKFPSSFDIPAFLDIPCMVLKNYTKFSKVVVLCKVVHGSKMFKHFKVNTSQKNAECFLLSYNFPKKYQENNVSF